jgi:hypothetical protein
MAAGAAAAAVGGSLIQLEGQRKADKAEAQAHRENANFQIEQANLIKKASEKEADVFKARGEEFIGEQRSAFAKAGVEMSGSALLQVAQSQRKIKDELGSIREEGLRNANVALNSAAESNRRANALSDPSMQQLQTAGTLLTGFGGAASALKK